MSTCLLTITRMNGTLHCIATLHCIFYDAVQLVKYVLKLLATVVLIKGLLFILTLILQPRFEKIPKDQVF